MLVRVRTGSSRPRRRVLVLSTDRQALPSLSIWRIELVFVQPKSQATLSFFIDIRS